MNFILIFFERLIGRKYSGIERQPSSISSESSKDSEDMEEGCLSIPEYFRPIKRSKKIKIKFIDEHGNKIKTKARGFLARVLQHETDHLYGTVIKDRFEKK